MMVRFERLNSQLNFGGTDQAARFRTLICDQLSRLLVRKAAAPFQQDAASHKELVRRHDRPKGTILLEVSCQIEIEFDETCSDDADDIQRRVEKAYAACRRAVEEELGRQG
jgi:hypothetical protein